jgi:predicted transcriptional regulator
MENSFERADTISRPIVLSQWQIDQVKKALVEADRGDFATEEDMTRTVERWTRLAR